MDLKKLLTGGTKDVVAGVLDGASNLVAKFKADPTKVVEFEKDLETLRINAELKTQELSNDLEKAYLADMNSARDREIQIATSDKAPLINKIIQPVLGLFIVCSTIIIWALILFRNYEPKTNEAMIIGSLTTLTGMVLSYYFGSSTGSASKQKQIEAMTK